MDNIKKFEDFLDRMQGLLDSAKKQGHILVRVEDLENTFPELRESEDKKIRGAIIDHLKDYGLTEWAAWLEKQGEQTDINPSEFDLRLNKLLKQFETLPKEELANCLSFYLNVVQNDGTYREEKQVEQKSSDKVEPKFKVGDWVVKGDTIAQILDIQEQYYVGLDINGKDFTSSRFLNDDKIHLWTINDAKDGDVLVSKYNRPFIYNGNRDFFHVGSYCGLSTSDKFIVSTSKCFWTKNVSILPATKEQRELLFKEMKETGYEWDSEHKQLKKIETMDKYEGLTDFERTLTDICIGWIGEEIGWKQYIKDNADILLKIAVEMFNSVQDATFEQKPAWSEEDEEELDIAISTLKEAGQYDSAKWLKSLKDRVQPKQEWSEEDNQYLCGLIGLIEQSKAELPITLKGKAADNCIDWLKSLRNRVKPKQEWSEEDESNWNNIWDVLDGRFELSDDGYKKAAKWFLENCPKGFESLKPQNHWKPTKEQMEALHDLNLTGGISYAGQGQVLIELYNDLKKL